MDQKQISTELLDKHISFYTKENQWIAFKQRIEDQEELGRYISALSNGACLAKEECGYLYLGLDEKDLWTNEGKLNEKSQTSAPEMSQLNHKAYLFEESLQLSLLQQLIPHIYLEIDTLLYKGTYEVVRFKIPSTQSQPTMFNQDAFIRVDGQLDLLAKYADWMRKIYTTGYDWSAQVISDASLDDLDPDAIIRAREGYKRCFHEKAQQCDAWTDEEFLESAGLTKNGEITRTTILLLGKEERSHFLNHIAEICWKCFQDGEIFGDIYTIPFIRTIPELLHRIRNYRFKIYPYGTVIPAEVWKYDQRSILECLYNCLAHMDYTKNARIIVTERMDSLTFESYGEFYQGNLENYALGKEKPNRYRNPFLRNAMININMIQSPGQGIHSLFQRQMDRYLPMPDYDTSSESSVVIHLPGKMIDENYSFLLIGNKSVTLEEALLLDKVQKGKRISEDEIAMLRQKRLIQGRKTKPYVAKQYKLVPCIEIRPRPSKASTK